MVHESVVEVLSSQVGVSSSCLYFEDALLNGQKGHIEGTTSEIKDENVALANSSLLVQAISNGSSSGLVDDAHAVETGNGSSVLGRLKNREYS
eukprot:CAMPEP_0114295396 /NCGR_PEP_ID=MMETSP0059-20121206/10671_1 /TAXON_ID=36894 /ORGANISM="Pyramimonas parkeae, Strain CCMP726" /LENGTH=92 /DNA_ID=CAMNT_0001417305 /DNA_START=106 /DNA_END=384 /DNA_ORIENTATION=+